MKLVALGIFFQNTADREGFLVRDFTNLDEALAWLANHDV
jgi:hypothetical protein